MVTIRKSTPKSRTGCHTCKIRHVKCDEAQPRCQRCTSTGRTCDGYEKERSPASPAGAPFLCALATRTRNISTSTSEEIQERRSFEFFRSETVPSIGGFFGSTSWNLVLQACNKEPAVSQAAIALGALHERLSISRDVGRSREIETSLPIRQYAKALCELRNYLSESKPTDLNIILICALIHISIEAIQNNYVNASVHLENSLHLLQNSIRTRQSPAAGTMVYRNPIDLDLGRAFMRLDLHASTFQGMRPPAMAESSTNISVPGRFSSLVQAKDILDQILAHLYFFNRSIAEDLKFRKEEDFPLDALAEAAQIKAEFDTWNDRFEKYLHRSTSRFSREEQIVIDVLIINHRLNSIEAATCIQPDAMVFDQFDTEFDEIVTLSATVIRSRKSSNAIDFQLDIGIIYPLYTTAIRCRELWIRQRAVSLLRSIKFREGVWNAATQAAIAQVAINREQSFMNHAKPNERPPEFARVHSVGVNSIDPAKRVAEINLTQKLNGLDGPWNDHVEWCSW